MIKNLFLKLDQALYHKDMDAFLSRNSAMIRVGEALLDLKADNGESETWVEDFNAFLRLYNTGRFAVYCRQNDHRLVKQNAIQFIEELEQLTEELKDIRARLLRGTK